jgi:hypothetical protein
MSALRVDDPVEIMPGTRLPNGAFVGGQRGTAAAVYRDDGHQMILFRRGEVEFPIRADDVDVLVGAR